MSSKYYSGVNPQLLARIPATARNILEVGCGEGNFGRAYLARNPLAKYVGVELSEKAALQAATCLSHVITGDIEQPDVQTASAKALGANSLFDTMIFGDVLEHLRDPWQVLSVLRSQAAPGANCIACIPNVSHWSIVSSLLRGRWDYADSGLLDRTHIRFFTLDTAVEMFRRVGWTVLDATPRILWRDKTEAALVALLPLAELIGSTPEKLRRDLSTFQWVIRATNGPVPKVLQIGAISAARVVGLSDARIDYPLSALNSLPEVRAVWNNKGISLDLKNPGIVVYQRRYLTEDYVNREIEELIKQGFVVTYDLDDDPRCDSVWVDTDFFAIRRVHAVTTSTEAVATLAREWNPNVTVFPNAIFAIPDVVKDCFHSGPVKIFFGAVNRESDWQPIIGSLVEAMLAISSQIELVVVHDKQFFDQIPDSIEKKFHPTLNHNEYLGLLASCDIALLPLADTEFNRMKSDLKLIECAACNVVPICSPTVYGDNPQHSQLAIFASAPGDWTRAIISLCADPQLRERLCAEGSNYVKSRRMHYYLVDSRLRYYSRLPGWPVKFPHLWPPQIPPPHDRMTAL